MRKRWLAGLGLAGAFLAAAGGLAGCEAGNRAVERPARPDPAEAVMPPPEARPRGVKTPGLPGGLAGYDFGAGAAWPDFAKVPGAKNVTLSPGARIDQEGDGDFPDPLLGDYVAAEKLTVTISGLPRGAVRGALIAQNVVRGMVPGKDFRVRANSNLIVDEKVTPEWFFSENGFFYGVRFDDVPGVDWWERYIKPVAPWREFQCRCDGKLVLELENCRLYALVVCPSKELDERQFATFLTATQAARKAHFLFNKLDFKPARPRGRLRVTHQHRERGYLVFSRAWGRDVNYNTLPRPQEIKLKLKSAGTPGERVPVTFSVRTLRKLEKAAVSISDLTSDSGRSIPASAVSVTAVRYMLRPEGEGYQVRGETLQVQEDLDLPARISKRWWLTVNVPPDAREGVYKGTITFSCANAPSTELDVSLKVYPFRLARPAASIGVWYEDPWIRGYCTGLLEGAPAPAASPGEAAAKGSAGRGDAIEAYRVRMLEADLESLHLHGFNGVTVPVPRVVSVTLDGKVTLDFSLVAPYRELLRKYSINTDFPGQTYLLTTARQITGVGAGGNPIEEYSQLHRLACMDAVAQIRDWWREGGVKLLAYAVDEPREEHTNPWNRNMQGTLYYLRLIRDVGGMSSTVTTMRDVQNGVSYRPILEAEDVVQPHPSPHNAKAVEYARETGKSLRYFNGGGFRRYDFGFYLWSQRPEGYWQWHFDFRSFSFNPFWDEHSGYVVYPSPEGPVPTLRYERAAQGIYDYRYVLTLERYIARARDSGRPEAVEAARVAARALREIRKACTPWVLDGDWQPVAVDDVLLSKWRGAIARHISTVKAAFEGKPAPARD